MLHERGIKFAANFRISSERFGWSNSGGTSDSRPPSKTLATVRSSAVSSSSSGTGQVMPTTAARRMVNSVKAH